MSIVADTLTTFTSATSANPDLFNAVPYTLKVNLTDLASNQSSLLIFTGSLTGSQSTRSATFTNTFNSPISLTEQIGANDYTVTLTTRARPPAPRLPPAVLPFSATSWPRSTSSRPAQAGVVAPAQEGVAAPAQEGVVAPVPLCRLRNRPASSWRVWGRRCSVCSAGVERRVSN